MKRASDDMFIPVMPRILDPSLKFSEETILNGLDKAKKEFRKSKENANGDVVIDMPLENIQSGNTEKKNSIITIIAKYKFHIIIVIALIILVGIVYYFYKQRSKTASSEKINEDTNSEKSTSSIDNNSTDKSEVNNSSNKNVEEISNYLSNYIDTSSDTDTDSSVNIQMFENKSHSNVEIKDLEEIIPSGLNTIQEEVEEVEEDYGDIIVFDADTDNMNDMEKENKEEVDIIIMNKSVDKYDSEETDSEQTEPEEMDELLKEADPLDVFNKYTN